MPTLGMNKNSQKKSNRGLILKLIATGQCSSRVELSKASGLTKAAISQIVNELIEKGYLEEGEKKVSSEPGRNQIVLHISEKAPHIAGVLVERGSCEAVICDMELNILKERKIQREWGSREELMEDVFTLMDDILEGEKNVIGIGAASIGSVDVKEGTIQRPLYFNGIENVQIRKQLEERYGLPVAFDHNNQSAVLAEYLYGNGRGYEDILLVSVGRGVGSGILVDGKRVHSYTGYPPEIGHVSIDFHGEKCVCGNIGCLEMYVNSDRVLQEFREATGLSCSYEDFCKMTDRPELDAIMCDTVEKLSCGILSTLNIMNSQIVLLCMDCCCWPEKYIRMIEKDINQKKFGNCETVVPVKKVHFMKKTEVLGAACNMLNLVFRGELIENRA